MKDREENMCFEYESMGGRIMPVSWWGGTGFQLAEPFCHLAEGLCHLAESLCHLAGSLCHLAGSFCHLAGSLCHLAESLCHLAEGFCQLAKMLFLLQKMDFLAKNVITAQYIADFDKKYLFYAIFTGNYFCISRELRHQNYKNHR